MLLKEKEEVEKFDRNNFDWKSEIKKNYLLLSAFSEIVTSMNDSKETGNEHFKKAEYEEAINYYKQSLRLAKQKEDDDEIERFMQNDAAFYQLKHNYLRINVILYSNMSMANIKLEHWSRAICAAVKGNRILERLKKLIDDDDKFEQEFGTLEEKLMYRRNTAFRN